jgi:hypothetical protein
MHRILLLPILVLASAFVLGCGPEGSTPAGPHPEFDQKGHAAGGQPEINRFTDVFDFVVPEGEGCPFAIRVEGQSKVIVQEFETHLVVHVNSNATVTNLATGFSIKDPGTFMNVVHFDELGNEETITAIGSVFRIVIPGQGIVAQDTGIITFDPATGDVLFEGGPHEVFHGEADVCAILSGGSA